MTSSISREGSLHNIPTEEAASATHQAYRSRRPTIQQPDQRLKRASLESSDKEKPASIPEIGKSDTLNEFECRAPELPAGLDGPTITVRAVIAGMIASVIGSTIAQVGHAYQMAEPDSAPCDLMKNKTNDSIISPTSLDVFVQTVSVHHRSSVCPSELSLRIQFSSTPAGASRLGPVHGCLTNLNVYRYFACCYVDCVNQFPVPAGGILARCRR